MAEEFILETRIDLDDEQARKKAQKFKDDYKEIKLKAEVTLGDSSKKFDNLKNRISTIKKQFQDAFKINPKTLSDIEKITADLTKLAQNLDNLKKQINDVKTSEQSLTDSAKKGQSSLISKYKTVQNAIDKINNKMRNGMSAESFKKAQAEVEALEKELKVLESQLSDDDKRKLTLYDFNRSKQQIADLITNMNKVETKINEVQSKASNLKFSTNTNNFNDITNRINSIRNQVKSDWKIGFNSKDALSQLQQIEHEISNLNKIDTLNAKFESVKNTIREAFDDSVVQQLESEIIGLTSNAKNLDGSFESAFNDVDRLLTEVTNDAKLMNSELKKNQNIEQSNLINQYKQLSNTIENLKNKMKSGIGEQAFKNSEEEVKRLEDELQKVETKLLDISKKKLEPFNASKSNKEIITFMSNMTKIETKVSELQSKLGNIKFLTNTSGFDSIRYQLTLLKNEVNKKRDINFETGSAINELKQLEVGFNNLVKVDALRSKFENVRDTIKDAFGATKVQAFESQIDSLTSKIFNMDGSFESAFTSLDSEFVKVTSEAKQMIAELEKADKIEQSQLIAEYRQLADTIDKVKSKMQNMNVSDDAYDELEAELYTLEDKLSDVAKKIADVNKYKIEAIDSKRSKKELDTLISELVKVDLKSQEVRNSLKNIRVTVDNQNTINQLISKLNILDSKKNLKMNFKDANNELAQIEKAISNLKKVDTLTSKFEKLEGAIRSAFGDSIADKLKTDLQNLNSITSVLDDTFEATFSNLKASIESVGNKANTITSNLKKITTVESSFVRVKEAIRTAFGDAEVQRLETAIENLKTSAKNMDATFDGALDGFKTDLAEVSSRANQVVSNLKKVDTIRGTFNALKADIEKAFGTQAVVEFESKLQALETEAKNLGGNFNTMASEMTTQLRRMQNQLTRTSNVTKTVSRFWMDFSGSLRTFTIGNILGNALTTSVYKIKSVFSELDAAMTDLKKVADIGDINTVEKLDAIQDKAMEVSKQVGMTTSETIEGIASALQAGMGSMEESIEVAKGAMMLANVGDLSQDEASKGLNTIVNSFDIEPLKETNIQVGDMTKKTTELTAAMDKLNYASNTQAIDMQNLIQAFQGGGATLSNYGVEIGDATAMITAANSSLQNGSKVGNGMKSLAINLQGMKANAKEGTLELNKTAKALKIIAGIDVYSDKKKGEIKDVVQLLDEIKGKWKDLSEDQQLGLAEAIAGKHQSAVFQALMQNYDIFLELRDEFANGDQFGSAAREKQHSPYVEKSA